MRRSPIFPLLALVLALIAAIAVHSALRAKDARIAQALSRSTDIIVASHDLPFGGKLSAESIRVVKWPADVLPPGALSKPGDVVGNVLRQAIAANEPILESQLINTDRKAGLLPLLIPQNMRAMSVQVDEVADISGFVLPHSRIDIVAAFSEGGPGAGKARTILENVEVLAVAQTTEKDQPDIEKVVTVLVTPQQAERLALVSHEASLRLALRSYDDDQMVESKGVSIGEIFGRSGPTPDSPSIQHIHALRPGLKVEVLRDGNSRQALIFDGPRGRLTEASQDGENPNPPMAAVDPTKSAQTAAAPVGVPPMAAAPMPAVNQQAQEQAYAIVQ